MNTLRQQLVSLRYKPALKSESDLLLWGAYSYVWYCIYILGIVLLLETLYMLFLYVFYFDVKLTLWFVHFKQISVVFSSGQ